MSKHNLISIIYFLICILLLSGCEKDKITAPLDVKLDTSAEFLLYLEDEGDIINNSVPPVIQALEVYNNLPDYLIIDLRDSLNYNNGHIQGSKNIGKDSLFSYVQGNYSRFSKVVLISASGQTAAYYSSLLHLAGFNNIYYMNYGMASWNVLFASVWMDRLYTYNDPSFFSYTLYSKRKYTPLPVINLKTPSESMQDLMKERVEGLIKEGFDEDYSSVYSQTSMTFNYWLHISPNQYTICTGPIMLYSSNPYVTNTYHLIGSVFYQVFPDPSDFRSTSYLQTVPSDSSVAVYSATGQESAFYTAYLRLLGYDARSILFGVNNIDYNMLFRASELIPFAFKTSYIMNFPYITGTN
jgi:rhodanese-related sulfurtransferase